MAHPSRQAVLGDEFAELFADAPDGSAAGRPAGGRSASAPSAAEREALCARLTANLRAQLALYREYRDHAERQRMALVNRRLAENIDANASIDKLLNALAGLEEERIALTGSILPPSADGGAAPPVPVKCEAIYPLVSPRAAAALKACRDELVSAVADLKRILAVNEALIENGSRIIRASIGILTSVAGRTKADRMGMYTAKGGVRYAKVQIRNLVNRSV